MDSYKTKRFAKWAKSEGLSDENLDHALEEMERGLQGDSLGSYIFKKRVGLAGRGKRGGARTIVIFKKADVALFVFGYAKNDKSDLTSQEEAQLRIFAKGFMTLTQRDRRAKQEAGELVVIKRNTK